LTERKFGRIASFDEESKRFSIRSLIPAKAKPRSYTWSCGVNLDQGSEGSCCGFSVAQEAAARPVVVSGITNEIALELYNRAKQLDEFEGEDYDGSSVLAAIKAGAEKGWYPEYRWAFSEADLALAIGHHGPAVLGINWFEGMNEPDEQGMIYVTGRCLGGHAILCNGYDFPHRLYRLHQSWGLPFGINGECFIRAEDMSRLLRQDGEACVPVVRGQTIV